MPRWVHKVFAVLTMGPVALWLISIAVTLSLGKFGGCVIHEGFANPCVLAGRDWGETAYAVGVFAAWGPLIFAPYVVVAGFGWVAVAVIGRWRRKG